MFNKIHNREQRVSDYQDFCESFGGCASDPDFIDNWMEKYLAIEVQEARNNIIDFLPTGKIIHIIKLLATHPAQPKGVIWNKELCAALPCIGSNYLKSDKYDDPASWFVRKGFTVRSVKTDGYWYQVAYKDTNSETLLNENERKDYESLCLSLDASWVRNWK